MADEKQDEADKPADTPGETEDQLPWLEKIDSPEDDEAPSGSLRTAAAWAVGAVLLVAAVLALILSTQWNASNQTAAADDPFAAADSEPDPLLNVGGPAEPAPAAKDSPKAKAKSDARKAAPVRATTAQAEAAKASDGGRRRPDRDRRAAAAPTRRAAVSGPRQTIQIGAFSTRAAAERALRASRQSETRGLKASISRANVAGKTVYRVRLTGPGAARQCPGNRGSGRNCFVVTR